MREEAVMNLDAATEEMDDFDRANEEYEGAMEGVCLAVETWLDAQVQEIEMEPVEVAETALREAFDRYIALRNERAGEES
jgi:hypothetical protein